MPFARYWRSASECSGAQSVDCIRFLLPDASRHCEERGDEAIQLFSASLDRFARNDGLKIATRGIRAPVRAAIIERRAASMPSNFRYSEINVKPISENRNCFRF